MSHQVVVTAYGIASPIGMCGDSFARNLFAGKSGVKNLRGVVVPEDFPVPYAAWIDRADLGPSGLYPRPAETLKSWLLTEHVTRQAMTSLSPKDQIDAVIYGTADGVSYEIVEEVLREGLGKDFDFNTVCSQSSLETLRQVVHEKGFQPLEDRHLISVNGACASGNQTLGLAFEGLRHGRWKRCLVGGVDARCEPSNYLNFYLLGALTTADLPPEKASRPFSADRSGFVRGEGAAVLVLETLESALKRQAPILGYIRGYACTSDAYRLTDGREDGLSVKGAISMALQVAGLRPDEISYINAHGTATQLNDRLETAAIKEVFGQHAYSIPISSVKSQIGHSTIASSAIEAVACLLMLKNQRVSPTLNCEVPDPHCDLDYVPAESRAVNLQHILSNSFGFGGQNACVVFSQQGVSP